MRDDLNGMPRNQHGGAIGGFRSFAANYTSRNLNVVLLTNFSSSNVRGKAEAVAELFIDFGPPPAGQASKAPINLSGQDLKKYESHYWNETKNFGREIYAKNDTLWYFRSKGNETALIPVSKDRFKMAGGSESLIQFDLDGTNKKFIIGYGGNNPGNFEAYDPPQLDQETLSQYVGEFYSPELDTKYNVLSVRFRINCESKAIGRFEVNPFKE